MRILLLSMPDIFPYFRPWKMLAPNLALASLAGNLGEQHEVAIGDLVLKRGDVRGAVIEALDRVEPELVGLSAMTFQFDTAVRVARLAKQISPKTRIALGGYHATLMHREIAESPVGDSFDFLLRGEAEASFAELADILENGSDLTAIEGLSQRVDGDWTHNAARPVGDLAAVRLPDRTARLWRGYHCLGKPIDTIESSRGCYMGCSFCSIRGMYGRSFRTYPVSRVLQDVENAKRQGARSLFFTDDNITLDPDHFNELLDGIIAHGHDDVSYIVQLSSAGVTSSEGLAEKMRRAGFRFVFLGIENISRRNLAALQKGDIVDESRKAIELLQRNRIYVIGGLIIGNPDDDADDIEENYRFAHDMGISIYDQILTPYLKTELRDQLMEQGLITNPDDYRCYNGQFANVRTKFLSQDELDFIKHRMVQKYSRLFLKTVLENRSETPKEYFSFAVRQFPGALLEAVSKKWKGLFMSEEQRFRQDFERCLQENQFNL